MTRGFGQIKNMSRKYTTYEVKKLVIELGFFPIFNEYVNCHTEITLLDIKGYKYTTKLHRLNESRLPVKFGKSNKFTHENIKLWLLYKDKKFRLVSNKFVMSNDHLKWECTECGKKWKATWGHVKHSTGCPICNNIRAVEKRRFKIEDLKKKLQIISPRIEILDDNYISNNVKLLCRCDCREEWEIDWKHLLRQRCCPKCSRKEAYKNNKWHNKTIADRNKSKWKNIPAIVYTILCFNSCESFYKIGITSNSVNRRFYNNRTMPYNFKIVDEIYTNLYEAVYLEDTLHNNNKEYSYNPLIKFEGYTECFSELIKI